MRKAADVGLTPAGGVDGSLAGAPEAALARVVARFPEVVEDAVAAEETQGITAYATDLATTFHGFYRDARVVDVEPTGAVRGSAGARGGDPDHAGQRPAPARDLRARIDVAGGAGRLASADQTPVAPKITSRASSDVLARGDEDRDVRAGRRRDARGVGQAARSRRGSVGELRCVGRPCPRPCR